jgi:SAM-dependent methyltransferase
MTAADHARHSYDAFADAYDLFTRHHDYDAWTADIERLARAAGLAGDRLLDVACGTGKSFLPYLQRGWRVTACDISPAMVQVAAAKAAGRAELRAGDLRALPRLGAFDLVACMDDAVNYLLEPEELVAALRGMAANLAPGGLIVFDTNTLASYRSFFARMTVVQDSGRVVIWDGRAPVDLDAGGLAPVRVEVIAEQGDRWQRAVHEHVQRHIPEREVRAALAAAGLTCRGVWGMQLDGSLREGFAELANSKALYLAGHAGG